MIKLKSHQLAGVCPVCNGLSVDFQRIDIFNHYYLFSFSTPGNRWQDETNDSYQIGESFWQPRFFEVSIFLVSLWSVSGQWEWAEDDRLICIELSSIIENGLPRDHWYDTD